MFNWFFNLIKIAGAKKSTKSTNKDKSKPQEGQLKKAQDPLTRISELVTTVSIDPALDELVPDYCIPGNSETFCITLRDIGNAALNEFASNAKGHENREKGESLMRFTGSSDLQNLITQKNLGSMVEPDIVYYTVYKYLAKQKDLGLKPLFQGGSRKKGGSFEGILPSDFVQPQTLEDFIKENKDKDEFGLQDYSISFLKLAIIRAGRDLLQDKGYTVGTDALSDKIYKLALAYYDPKTKINPGISRDSLLSILGKKLINKLYASANATKHYFQDIQHILEDAPTVESLDKMFSDAEEEEDNGENTELNDYMALKLSENNELSSLVENKDFFTLLSEALESEKQAQDDPKEIFRELKLKLGKKLKRTKNENTILPYVLERYLLNYLQGGRKTNENLLEGNKLPDRLLEKYPKLEKIQEFVFNPTKILNTQEISKEDFHRIFNELLDEAYQQYIGKNNKELTKQEFIDAYNSGELKTSELRALKCFNTIATELFKVNDKGEERLPVDLFLSSRSYIKSLYTSMNTSTFAPTGTGAWENHIAYETSRLKQKKNALELELKLVEKEPDTNEKNNYKEELKAQIEELDKKIVSTQAFDIKTLIPTNNIDLPSDTLHPIMETLDTQLKTFIVSNLDLKENTSTYKKDYYNLSASFFLQIGKYFDKAFSGKKINNNIKNQVIHKLDLSANDIPAILYEMNTTHNTTKANLLNTLKDLRSSAQNKDEMNKQAITSFINKIAENIQILWHINIDTTNLIGVLLKCLNPNIALNNKEIELFFKQIYQAVFDNKLDKNEINTKLKELFPITDTNKVDYSSLNFPEILEGFVNIQKQAKDIQDVAALNDNFITIRSFDKQNTRLTNEDAPILEKQTFTEYKDYFDKQLQDYALNYLLDCFNLVKTQLENSFNSLNKKASGKNFELFKDKLLNPANFTEEAKQLKLASFKDLYDNPDKIVNIFSKDATTMRGRGKVLFIFLKYINYLMVVRQKALKCEYKSLNPFLDSLSLSSIQSGYINKTNKYKEKLVNALNDPKSVEGDELKKGTVLDEVLSDLTGKAEETKEIDSLYGTGALLNANMFNTLGTATQIFTTRYTQYLKTKPQHQQILKEGDYEIIDTFRAYPKGVVFHTKDPEQKQHYYYAPEISFDKARNTDKINPDAYQELTPDYAKQHLIIIEPIYWGEPIQNKDSNDVDPNAIVIKDSKFDNYFLAIYTGAFEIDETTLSLKKKTSLDNIDQLKVIQAIPAPIDAYLLLSSGKVKENDTQYNIVLTSVLENAFYSYLLLYKGIINREHAQYDNVLTSALKGIRSTCRLVKNNIITENDPQYKEALNTIIQNGASLIDDQEITQEELDTYKKQLNIQQETSETKPGEGGDSGETLEQTTEPAETNSNEGTPEQQPETAPAQEQPKTEKQTPEKKDSTEEYKPTDNENNLAKNQGFNIYLQKKAADEELPYTPNTFETSNVEGVGYNPGAEQSMVHKETEKHFSLSKLGLLLKNAMRIDKSFVNYLETTIKQADIPNPDQIIDFINCLIQAGGEPTNATRIYNQKNATNKDRSYFWRTIKGHIWPTLRKNDTIISVAEKLNCNDIIEE